MISSAAALFLAHCSQRFSPRDSVDADSTKPYICCIIFLYIHTYDKALNYKLGTVKY
jgi:hypothetical protein